MSSVKEATDAIRQFNNHKIGRHILNVKISQTLEDKQRKEQYKRVSSMYNPKRLSHQFLAPTGKWEAL